MPLRIRFDHRLDRLADALIARLDEAAGDPLARHALVVPAIGVGRWLQQRVAERTGICAQVSLELPGRYLWTRLRAAIPALPARSPFEPDAARWSILRLFDELPEGDDFAVLRARVGSAPSAQRLATATAIAELFDRYLAWRRDWLARWQRGRWAAGDAPMSPHEGWQRWLWQRLLERLPGVSGEHPYDRFEAMLAGDAEAARQSLGGERVTLVGALSMAPEQLALFGRLGEVADVAIFATDPCREFWEDMLDSKSLARIAAASPEQAWLYDGEPSVLGNWGRAQRDWVAQLAQLAEAAGVQAEEPLRERDWPFEVADEDAPLTALQALQASVFLRSDAPWSRAGDPADRSLQAHATHGVVRQAEVLHDCLLECFADDPTLEPRDVAVFCTNLDEAADAIEAVFGGAPPARRIPVSVSGRSARADPMARAALDLLGLALQRVSLRAVSAWLENPAAMEALGLDEEAVSALGAALDAAGARWGLGAEDGPEKHSWQAAIDRLLVGAALGAGVDRAGDVVAVTGVRSGDAERLAALLPALEAAQAIAQADAREATLEEWGRVALRALGQVLGATRRHVDGLQSVRDAVADLLEGAAHEPAVRLDARAFLDALAARLDAGAQAALPGGAVTVCPIGGLRGVPFRVVCLFGMDEAAFPRRTVRGEFDLIARAPRPGDRLARTEDRGVFLDALLAARDRAIVLWRGRDARDDSELNPSAVVAELLEYVAARWPGTEPPSVRVHPLHPFSVRSFVPRGAGAPRRGEARSEPPSFAAEWLDTARAFARPLAQRAEALGPLALPGAAGEQPPPVPADRGPVSVGDLVEALARPARAWLREALGLELARETPPPEDTEPLWAGGKDLDLVDAALRKLLRGEPEPSVRDWLLGHPQVAAGAAARLQSDSILARALDLRQALFQPLANDGAARPAWRAAEAVTVRVPGAGPDGAGQAAWPVTGVLDRIDAAGSQLLASPWPLNARALIDAWVRHAFRVAALQAAGGLREGEAVPATVLATPDFLATFDFADGASALRHALGWRSRILGEPLALFPRTTLAWFDAGGDGRDDKAREKAQAVLLGDEGGWQAGELGDAWNAALWRDAEPELDLVLETGKAAYGPIFFGCRRQKR